MDLSSCKSNSVGTAGVRGMTRFFDARIFSSMEVGGSSHRFVIPLLRT